MKRICRWLWQDTPLNTEQLSLAILFLRVFIGIMMIPYGWGKITDFDRYAENFFDDPIGIGHLPSLILTIFAQIICSVFLIIGFRTRISAIILAFNMAVATKYHFYDPFSVKALPILFLGIYITIIMLGGGRYTLDKWLTRTSDNNNPETFYTPNISPIERTIQMLLCFILCCIVFSNSTSDIVSISLLIIALLLLVTSFIGYSVIYHFKNDK
ncbi:MAG: DoxX family protein [Bacteroidaceae bacterium]|nr:DoxX family protein [Bacteroidaceae bacterium]